ncbi:MAG TPA: hypothetical protein VMT30_07115 [Candidatus Saccharimonadia bacterium]|nr:hypothetical protein [Candidatus Saccharimonadia bacterium]
MRGWLQHALAIGSPKEPEASQHDVHLFYLASLATQFPSPQPGLLSPEHELLGAPCSAVAMIPYGLLDGVPCSAISFLEYWGEPGASSCSVIGSVLATAAGHQLVYSMSAAHSLFWDPDEMPSDANSPLSLYLSRAWHPIPGSPLARAIQLNCNGGIMDSHELFEGSVLAGVFGLLRSEGALILPPGNYSVAMMAAVLPTLIRRDYVFYTIGSEGDIQHYCPRLGIESVLLTAPVLVLAQRHRQAFNDYII